MYLPAEMDEGLQYSIYTEVSNLLFKKEVLHGESLWLATGSAAVLGFS